WDPKAGGCRSRSICSPRTDSSRSRSVRGPSGWRWRSRTRWARSGGREAVQAQAVERGPPAEPPSEVRAAAPAEGDLPGAAWEPAPVRRRLAHLAAAGRLREAGDHVLEAVRVDERARLLSVEGDAVAVAGHVCAASRTPPDGTVFRGDRATRLLSVLPQHAGHCRPAAAARVAFQGAACHGVRVFERLLVAP